MESSDDVVISNGLDNDRMVSNAKEDTIGVEFLEDFDSYMEDINERLVVSRMVSDSVMKGIVNAVEQEASERITDKEFEISLLKESLSFHQTGSDRSGYSDDVGSLRIVAIDLVKKMKKEIDRLKGGSPSIRKMASGSELMGLGEILQDKVSNNFAVMENSLDDLETTIDKICSEDSSISEWKHEQELQRELEGFIIQISIKNLQEEFAESLKYQSCSYCENMVEKINKISSLRKDLNEILNSVSNSESHNLDSHHRKFSLDSHVFSSIMRGNGVSNESTNGTLDKWSAAQFKHLQKDELVEYFNTEISKMRRNHESTVQEMTEDYFTLRREYLKENGSSSPFRKDKELDVLKKKIQEIISRLDDIPLENKKLSVVTNGDRLNDRLNDLTSENHQLRETILEKKKEMTFLSDQASNASEKMTQYSLNEIKLLKSIEDLRSFEENTFLENLIASEVFKCTFEDLRSFQAINATTEALEIDEAELEHLAMQGLCEILYEEALKEAELQIKELKIRNASEFDRRVHLEHNVTEKEDKLKSLIHEKEDLEKKLKLAELLVEKHGNSTFEMSMLLTKEKERVELAYKEINDLKEKTCLQESLISEKSKELDAIKSKLLEISQQNEAHTLQIRELKENLESLTLQFTSIDKERQSLLAANQEKLGALSLLEAKEEKQREQNEAQTLEISELKENFESLVLQFTSVDEERQRLVAANQEKLGALVLLEANEETQRKQINALSVSVSSLSDSLAKFEDKVFEDIKNDSSRLEGLSYEVRPLIKDVKILKRTSFLYKQQLERVSDTLQLAEAEVDLLGDEVDVLLGLLKKIYIGLDHYSPILQYYPGIMEILRLVQRELRVEPTKHAS
ncbi:WPP domain-associated protein [Impatiens glandulifera]|uniref:WPP domain-associated protein n=1 Tax=Impatiens glandulifera TaxID=253017 RepID=UPI001FB0FCC3|nr:WPP domain-associated protein [Impatiens glandulifera]XP_047325348.1 WPP domain-associated protein [Impatiens glandulifera]